MMKPKHHAAELAKTPKLSRTHAPADLTPADWQRRLRRQFGREQAFSLENLGAEPGAKAVVFSQWVRTHHIVIRRLEARGIDYVSFHGGVPSEKRPALVERCRDDPDCRVFLSTDAGATGLNLQYASTLVNMDLPWNPALLEQRISRIHRMGQSQPVRIVNFIAKCTIEEGMLSVLAFKRSLSAGILDGGASEISLGGSRLNRFMKDVENVTGRMGEGETMGSEEELANATATSGDAPTYATPSDEKVDADQMEQGTSASAQSDASADPLAVLLQAGSQFVSALTAAGDSSGEFHPWIERDPGTGARSLKVPLPTPEMTRRLADTLSAVADALRGKDSGR